MPQEPLSFQLAGALSRPRRLRHINLIGGSGLRGDAEDWRFARTRVYAAAEQAPPPDAPSPSPAGQLLKTRLKWLAVGSAGVLVVVAGVLVFSPEIRHDLGIGTSPASSTPQAQTSTAGGRATSGQPVVAPTGTAVSRSHISMPHPSGPEQWQSPYAQNPESVTIDRELDAIEIDRSDSIWGRHGALGSGHTVWLLVHPENSPDVFPQTRCQSDGSGRSFDCSEVKFGDDKGAPGLWYAVTAIVIDGSDEPSFEAKVEYGYPISGPPPGTIFSMSNTIWVRRK